MKNHAAIASFVFGLGVLAVSSMAGDLDDREKSHRQIAERRGSLEHYKRGKEILRKKVWDSGFVTGAIMTNGIDAGPDSSAIQPGLDCPVARVPEARATGSLPRSPE